MSYLMRKVNADDNCNTYESQTAFREALPWDEKRVTYIASRWDVSRNCARTLILKEVGKTTREIADMLYVTESTVASYVRELCEKIHVNVVMGIEYKRARGVKYDVWGKGKADVPKVTESKEEVDVKFRPREKPLNRGTPITEIPKELISLNLEVSG